MKTLPLSLCALSGALMASVGTIVENLEETRRRNMLDELGMCITVIAVLATILFTFRADK